MLRWLKRVFISLILLIYGRGRYEQFVAEVKRHCKKRQKWRHAHGITEELDELSSVPPHCIDDVSFVGCTKDGQMASFRVAKADKEYAALSMDFPGFGRFSHKQSKGVQLGASSLKLQVLEPMRRWKISFNGRMECCTEKGSTELLHVSVSLYWQCFADPFDFCSSLSIWQLARNLSGIALSSANLKKLMNRESIAYEQWGDMWGKVDIEGGDSQLIRLKGIRKHKIERVGCMLEETAVSHHIVQDKGCYFVTNGGILGPNGFSGETFGYLTLPVGEQWITEQSDLMCSKGDGNCSTMQYPVQMNADGSPFQIDKVLMKSIPLRLQSSAFDTSASFTKFTINGESAYGVISQDVTLPLNNREETATERLNCEEKQACKKLTITLGEIDSRCTSLVGGKAANMSILRGLEYTVPNGFSVTTQAMKEQLDSHAELRHAAERIASEYRNANTFAEERSAVCAEAVKTWTDSVLSPSISSAIENELLRSFGRGFKDVAFAVRSSAVSEDGAESSFAGQMDTYLGVKGLENILLAVRKCWASSFAYQAIEYRRQNGQPIIEEMAVVIMQMVKSEVAGVLFTNDPVTGNTSTMVINAAPGLGETVVSGKCNPDTIKIRRSNGLDDFKITSTVIGAIPFKLICAPGSGITEVSTDEPERKELCISPEEISELCRIGLQVEAHYGIGQDIEWARSGGKIHLLQTRPITTQNEESNDELMHEFDTPLATEFECVSTSQVGELLPGCATTLTLDLALQGSSVSLGEFIGANSSIKFPKYANKAILTFTNRSFLGMTAFSVLADGFMQEKSNLDISLAGRELHEHTMEMIRSYKGGKGSKVRSFLAFLNANFIQAPRLTKWFSEWEKGVETFAIGTDDTNAVELYSSIDEKLPIMFKAAQAYSFVATRSHIPVGIVYKMLRGKNTTITTEVNADMAVMLANCPKLFSADVPRSIQRLASTIASSAGTKDAFSKVPDSEGHSCLMSSEEPIRKQYEEFLRMHGHRGIKEGELIEKSWEADPSTLMRTVKMMIKSPLDEPQAREDAKSNAEIIGMLSTKLTWFQKFLLRTVLLDRAKAGIAKRESAKSVIIKTNNVFKKAFWRLADMMVTEGRLPEPKLVFFLTHIEIGTLLETRSAALIRKARRRMHLLRKQEAICYLAMNYGPPMPVTEERFQTGETSLTVSGVPVGKGVATARACVVLTLDDADNIQMGDILICPFTDIGWSPYFPMLAGLVTEIGGLISHGAVVAREVGIPCVVNAADATKLFKTGDRVKIDGLAGLVQKLIDD